jgi:hypothetical protein
VSTESKAHVLKRLDESWPELEALLDRIPEAEYTAPGIVDAWSLNELLGHVIFWADKAAGDVTLSASGKPDDIETPGNQENVDRWNADAAAKGKAMSAAEVRKGAAAAHIAARTALEQAPEAALAPVVNGWTVGVRFAEDTYRHYEEHAKQIRAWLREMETTEK